ncbi:MAG: exodeoxyribonuclease V subunit alpha [Planctomycetes bacterium]|nr:exodeoxyribonuclease V subunit alpha [Planctomycetota bacterium]
MSRKRQVVLPWTPFGAASAGEGILSPLAASQADALAVFRHVVRNAANEYDLGSEQGALAWELASWQEGLDEVERQALFLLTFCTLVDQSRGSTRTPAPSPEQPSEALAALLAPGDEPPAALPSVAEVSATLARLLGPELGRLSRVLVEVSGPLSPAPPETPLVLEAGHVYHQKLLLAEDRLARAVRGLLEARPSPAIAPDLQASALAAVLDNPPLVSGAPLELAPEQVQAVETTLGGSLTVVSGGPGTGKTSILANLLRVLIRVGIEPTSIALAAPTGKAAQRVRESLEASLAQLSAPDPEDERLAADLPEASTLHRLLGASRRGTWFRHHEHDPLAEQVVIVDEGSMIDLHLFDRLVRALRPGARLILLGDADQLPSVGAGTVLRDLIPPTGPATPPESTHPLAACSVRLTRNYRMDPKDPGGSAVLGLAQAIQAGASVEGLLESRAKVAEVEFEGVESLLRESGEDVLEAFLRRWFQTQIRSLPDFAQVLRTPFALSETGQFEAVDLARLEGLFAHYARARILCPTRVHYQGVNTINAALHQTLQITFGASAAAAYVLGEPLLATVNDYEKGLFNGDQGLVLQVQPTPGASPRPRGVFATSTGYRSFPLDLLHGQIEHAFATTVHKAQGSEFEHVALVLPERETALLTREVLYTAVTRARRSVVLIGDPGLWEAALGRMISRFTGLADRLADCASGPSGQGVAP